jgi:hypothetical protein
VPGHFRHGLRTQRLGGNGAAPAEIGCQQAAGGGRGILRATAVHRRRRAAPLSCAALQGEPGPARKRRAAPLAWSCSARRAASALAALSM